MFQKSAQILRQYGHQTTEKVNHESTHDSSSYNKQIYKSPKKKDETWCPTMHPNFNRIDQYYISYIKHQLLRSYLLSNAKTSGVKCNENGHIMHENFQKHEVSTHLYIDEAI